MQMVILKMKCEDLTSGISEEPQKCSFSTNDGLTLVFLTLNNLISPLNFKLLDTLINRKL